MTEPGIACLCRNLITDAIFRIQPESWCSLKATAQRYQEIIRNLSLGETDFLSFGAIHINVKLRLVKGLLMRRSVVPETYLTFSSSVSANCRLACRSFPIT